MSQALYETESPQGEITGKGFPDHDEFGERRDNATNSRAIQMCYPGGENPQNLHIIPGEITIGRRDGNLYNTNGEPNERGFTSLSGFYWGRFRSLEAAMRYHYFQGVVKTEYMIDSAQQGEGGYSYLRAGSCSIVNNGKGDIYAGDLVEWVFPMTYRELQRQTSTNRPAGVGNDIVWGNRAGTPMTKVLVEVQRFDPMDFSTCLGAAWDVMNRPPAGQGQSNSGIQGLLYTALFKKMGMTDASNLESLQEEALGLQNGLLMMGVMMAKQMLAGNDVTLTDPVHKICEQLGMWKVDNAAEITQAAKDKGMSVLSVLFRSYTTKDRGAADTAIRTQFGLANANAWKETLRTPYATDSITLGVQLANDPLGMLMGAITSAQHARTSRIIGKAMSSASKSDTLHIMIGHFRNC